MSTMAIPIKNEEELKFIKEACYKAGIVMSELKKLIRAGITTEYLNDFAEKIIRKLKARPAFKNYKGYPKAICASVNNEVVHGIPSKSKVLNEGDIISIDLGVDYKGYYGDLAASFEIGQVSQRAKNLIYVTKSALYLAINKAIVGNRIGDISQTIQKYVEGHGYSAVRKFVGHGIGKQLHEEPEIPNFGISNTGPILKNGMTLAIETMVNEGDFEVEILEDGWTAVTKDGKLACHFEHTILVRGESPLILTEFENA